MTGEPKAMKEIHDIRERIYEETKDMTAGEYNARVRARSQALLARYGIKLEKLVPPTPRTTPKMI